MSVNASLAPAEVQGAVAAEVERQLKAFVKRSTASWPRCASGRWTSRDDHRVQRRPRQGARGLRAGDGRRGGRARDLDFFTFWGLSALKKKQAAAGQKNLMFSIMTPASSEALGTSKMNFFGMGAVMLRKMMKDKEIASLEELIGDRARAERQDDRVHDRCLPMDAMGVSKDELLDDLTYGGVATYMADAVRSRVTLFI